MNFTDPSGLNPAGPNTRYGPCPPGSARCSDLFAGGPLLQPGFNNFYFAHHAPGSTEGGGYHQLSIHVSGPGHFGPAEEFGGGQTVDRKQTYISCRNEALRNLAKYLEAVAHAYPSNSEKLFGVISGASGGSRALGWAGGPVGAVVGAGMGAAVGVLIVQGKASRVESVPVNQFYKESNKCDEIARREVQAMRNTGPAMSSNSNRLPQVFVITKASGVFALYAYTLKMRTSLGDFVYEVHGPNPRDPVTRRFGR